MTMHTITALCRCGHAEWEHSVVLGDCQGRVFGRPEGLHRSVREVTMCRCAAYLPAAAPVRMGWRERAARIIRAVIG